MSLTSSMPLIDALQVERLDRYLFRGFTPKPSLPRIFGGQVLAQAMNAAARTVGEFRPLHSFHAYFLRPGNPDKQIIYEVNPIRDGGSFTTRLVTATQDGEAIYTCTLSFMKKEDGFSHQEAMPSDIPAPESVMTEEEFSEKMKSKYPDKKIMEFSFPGWDIRDISAVDYFEPDQLPPARGIWLRFKPQINSAPLLHKTLLAYVSDVKFLSTAIMPHGVSLRGNTIQFASLDHSMYFHNSDNINVNDWIYYKTESHWAGNSRGLNIGKLYSKDGLLIATTIQEGLMRMIDK